MLFAQVGKLTGIDFQEAIFLVFLLVAFAFFLWMLYILQTCLRRIPPVHREMQPWQVWLVLIPGAGWFFVLFVFPYLSRSFQNYFEEHPRADVGRCGHQLSLWVAWAFVLSQLVLLLITSVGIFLTLVFIVLLVLFVLEATELKRLIPVDAAERAAHAAESKKTATKAAAMWRDNRADSWHSTSPGKRPPDEALAASIEIELDVDSLTSALGQPEPEDAQVSPPVDTKPAGESAGGEPAA